MSFKKVKIHKKYQVCRMSIEILASKLPDVMSTYRHLSHTVFSCIVSCVRTSELLAKPSTGRCAFSKAAPQM